MIKVGHVFQISKFSEEFIIHFKSMEHVNIIQSYYKTDDLMESASATTYKKKLNTIVEQLNGEDFIIMHNLIPRAHVDILQAINSKKVIWLGWGADYYSLTDFDLFTDRTKSLIDTIYNKNLLKKWLKNSLIFKLYKHKKEDSYKKKIIEQITTKVLVFSPIIAEEKKICDPFFSKDISYIDWKYPNKFVQQAEPFHLYDTKTNILAGNSGSVINNHIEIIEQVIEYGLANQKLIIPFSYDHDTKYKNYITKLVKESGLNAELLIYFMKKEEYYKIIEETGFAIFNSKRQNALGNIIILLQSGTKIFLRKENPLYQYLINNGFIVFAIEDLCKSSLQTGISNEDKKHNFHLAYALFGPESSHKRTQELFRYLEEQFNLR